MGFTSHTFDHPCPGCQGYGAMPCGVCDGTGSISMATTVSSGAEHAASAEAPARHPCRDCHGTGAVQCQQCHGKGRRGPLPEARSEEIRLG